MKLRNKKTGEIVNAMEVDLYTDAVYLKISKDGRYDSIEYDSLAKLNEEWEDYEEPKEYWFIDWTNSEGIDKFKESGDDVDIFNKSIGNYFETKEEAEKAVEKLKAWKRLKDAGFKFTDWHRDICEVAIEAEIHDDGTMGMITDLNLLFGGEE